MTSFAFEYKGLTATTNNLGCDVETVAEKGLLVPDVQFKVINTSTNSDIGFFNFAPMPGCCGVIVSHNTYLNKEIRGSYNSQAFRELKTALAKKLGYGAMIATTRMHEPASVGNMMKSKYRIESVFKNKRTDHYIGIGVKVL